MDSFGVSRCSFLTNLSFVLSISSLIFVPCHPSFPCTPLSSFCPIRSLSNFSPCIAFQIILSKSMLVLLLFICIFTDSTNFFLSPTCFLYLPSAYASFFHLPFNSCTFGCFTSIWRLVAIRSLSLSLSLSSCTGKHLLVNKWLAILIC